MVFAYARVSTKEQNNDRQTEAINQYCQEKGIKVDRCYTDNISGKNFERPEYGFLRGNLRSGNTIIIKELDRLGRNMNLIKKEWQYFIDNQIDVIVIDNSILSTKTKTDLEKTLISSIVFELLSYMAEKERIKIKQRQSEGIAIAKQKGKHLGRPAISMPENWNSIIESWKKGEVTARKASQMCGFSVHSFYRKVKLQKEF